MSQFGESNGGIENPVGELGSYVSISAENRVVSYSFLDRSGLLLYTKSFPDFFL